MDMVAKVVERTSISLHVVWKDLAPERDSVWFQKPPGSGTIRVFWPGTYTGRTVGEVRRGLGGTSGHFRRRLVCKSYPLMYFINCGFRFNSEAFNFTRYFCRRFVAAWGWPILEIVHLKGYFKLFHG